MSIQLIAFGQHEDGRVWQETSYHYPSVLDAKDAGGSHYRAEGFYVVSVNYCPEQDCDLSRIVYESNTEGWCLQLYPFWNVIKVPAAACQIPAAA